MGSSPAALFVADPPAFLVATLRLGMRGQLVRLAEEAAAATMLGTLALVMSHGVQLVRRRVGAVVDIECQGSGRDRLLERGDDARNAQVFSSGDQVGSSISYPSDRYALRRLANMRRSTGSSAST